jgi:histone deacetylase 1/2
LNTDLRSFFSANGISYRLSCPHTSPQNGKAERLIRTTNDIVRTLLLQAKLPAKFWVEALNTATHLLNLRPSRVVNYATPHLLLFRPTPHLLPPTCIRMPLLP